MAALVLDDSQLQLVREAEGQIPVCDGFGRDVGVLVPASMLNGATIRLTPEELQKLADRLSMTDVKWSTTEEVLQRLKTRTATGPG